MLDLRYSNFGINIFNTISSLADEYNAVNLANSYPDFPLNQPVIDAVNNSIAKSTRGFAPTQGLLSLRQNISEKYSSIFNKNYSAEDEITITAGYTQALFSAISAIIKENDEVILFEPSHDNYVSMVEVNGGRPVFAALKPTDFSIDWDSVQKMVTPQTRLIIINTPHNPTGTVMTELDMLRLQKLINGTKILVLSDELFDHVVYDGQFRHSVALYPKLAEKSIIVSSPAEANYVPGWQLGYCIAPAAITNEIRKHQQIMIYSVSSPMQHAFASIPFNKESYYSHAAIYQAKRERFCNGLEGSLFKVVPSQGSYFQILRYNDISKEADTDFAIRLIKEFGVATLPISAFYHEKSVKRELRVNFAQPDDVIDLALERLQKVGK